MPGAKSLAKSSSDSVVNLPVRRQENVQIVKPIPSYSCYLSSEVRKATVEAWDPHSKSGKDSLYPSATRLATAKNAFGKPSLSHSFTREPSFENIAIFLLRSFILDDYAFLALLRASSLLCVLWKHLVLLCAVDF